MMESEIKLAWRQGFAAALTLFTEVEEDQFWELAEEAWKEQRVTTTVDWNSQRIAHRDDND